MRTLITSILDLSHLTKMELVCSQGSEDDKSASYCDSRRILDVGGVVFVILVL
jgi:hypothetical protein